MKTLDEFVDELKKIQRVYGVFAVEMEDGSEPTAEVSEGSPDEPPVIVIA